MIRKLSGDILLTKAEAVAHGVAPNDHFDQGLALSLRKRWPAMYKDFRHYTHQEHPKPGGLWFWGGPEQTQILSLFTQEGDSRAKGSRPGKASLENVNHCLRELKKFIVKEGLKSIALPRLATGVGCLDWDDVLPLIESHLGELDCEVIVYEEYHAGVNAEES